MSSRYEIHYQLRSHKRDQFIEFVKSLLLGPFVLNTRQAMAETLEQIEHLIRQHRQFSHQVPHKRHRISVVIRLVLMS